MQSPFDVRLEKNVQHVMFDLTFEKILGCPKFSTKDYSDFQLHKKITTSSAPLIDETTLQNRITLFTEQLTVSASPHDKYKFDTIAKRRISCPVRILAQDIAFSASTKPEAILEITRKHCTYTRRALRYSDTLVPLKSTFSIGDRKIECEIQFDEFLWVFVAMRSIDILTEDGLQDHFFEVLDPTSFRSILNSFYQLAIKHRESQLYANLKRYSTYCKIDLLAKSIKKNEQLLKKQDAEYQKFYNKSLKPDSDWSIFDLQPHETTDEHLKQMTKTIYKTQTRHSHPMHLRLTRFQIECISQMLSMPENKHITFEELFSKTPNEPFDDFFSKTSADSLITNFEKLPKLSAWHSTALNIRGSSNPPIWQRVALSFWEKCQDDLLAYSSTIMVPLFHAIYQNFKTNGDTLMTLEDWQIDDFEITAIKNHLDQLAAEIQTQKDSLAQLILESEQMTAL